MGKKIVAFLMAVFMLLSFASCSDNEQNVYVYGDEVHTAEPQTNGAETEEAEENYYEEVETTEKQVVTTKKQQTTKKQTTENNNSSSHVHRYSSATCTSPKMCSCGKTAGTALGHSYSAANCTSPKICNRCGETVGSALGHNFRNATCTSAKKCTRCGKTSGSALGHNYVNNKCSRCGKVDPDSLPVGLNELFVMDSRNYTFTTWSVTDTFGNKYTNVHDFNYVWDGAHASFNMNNKYKTFKGSIVLPPSVTENCEITVMIYVDNELKYKKSGITKFTDKVDFSINVDHGKVLRIEVTSGGWSYDQCYIVNAQLAK